MSKCGRCGDNGFYYTQAKPCECEAGQKMEAGVREALADVEAGRLTPWDELERKLPLPAEPAQKGETNA